MTMAASVLMALSLVAAPDMLAQTRTSSGSSTRSSSSGGASRSSSSATRSSSGQQVTRSSSSSSGSATRSSSSATRSSSGQQVTRSSSSSSGSATRSSSSATRSSSGQQVTRSSSSSSGSATRSSSSSSATRSSSGQQVTRSSSSSSGSATRSSSGSAVRSSSASAASTATRAASNVSRSGLSSDPTVSSSGKQAEVYRDAGYNYRYANDMRVDNSHNMYRVPPRERDIMAWDRPGYFWGDHPHYYGYRIKTPPPSWRRISHWGLDYYFYNGVYYRPYGGYYVVCRPPFGTPLERAIDRAILHSIRFAYYCDTYRTFARTFDYYNVIARQNLIIAQQNARIIAARSNYAINSNRALTAYELANKLGLVQSYAYANSDYFYQDGVFYTISASGAYSTIVPPAGALVTSLPDDYEIIVMNGIEYYLVDNTVYRTTLFEGIPYLEVLGQMYGSLYTQYDIYR